MPESEKNLFSKRSVADVAAIFVLFAGLLAWENRPLWCKYGFAVWSGAWEHCTSQNLLDPYSLSHVLHGIIFYWLLRLIAPQVELHWRLVAAVGIEVGWELLENSAWVIERYREQTASLDYSGDSIANSLSDVLMAAIGFCVASRVSWKAAVIVFVVFELTMLCIARDNLTLSVLMLFRPLEAIKQWQMQGM